MTTRELIEKVRVIDANAAEYLEEIAHVYKKQRCADMSEWFLWHESPQGYEFWENIFIKLEVSGEL